ncbi:hypothetical protein [Nocardiopsis protaetiae]|uniref:hypothetical protein n=1 Tax=Nocardiopsis protaetiae TaxID=3382270 RepID=UPI00387B2798
MRSPVWTAGWGLALVGTVGVLVAADASWVWAESREGAEQEAAALLQIVDRVQLILIVLGTALGTLFLTIAGVRWMVAGGEPGSIDSAKRALTGTAIGYGIAVLAGTLMQILDWVLATQAGGGQ